MIKDNRIVKYNVDFVFKDFKYKQGNVRIDLSNLKEMRGYVNSSWSREYSLHHLKKLLHEATGVGGGWHIELESESRSDWNPESIKYVFTINSRLYKNLRRIYETR